mmetsp:Transcript_103371/g.291867  ORF Transcript_103371/g.291867 Transcript_103371/m.291867 type:complete len:343 (-) Transcript_103371:22-1050(-)
MGRLNVASADQRVEQIRGKLRLRVAYAKLPVRIQTPSVDAAVGAHRHGMRPACRDARDRRRDRVEQLRLEGRLAFLPETQLTASILSPRQALQRLCAREDVRIAAADRRHAEGRNCRRETRHCVDLGEEARLAMERLAPRVHVAFLRNGDGEIRPSRNELHVSVPQRGNSLELQHVPGAAMSIRSIHRDALAVHGALLGEHQNMLLADGDLPDVAFDRVELGAFRRLRLGTVTRETIHRRLPLVRRRHCGLAGDVGTVELRRHHADILVGEARLHSQLAATLAVKQEELATGDHRQSAENTKPLMQLGSAVPGRGTWSNAAHTFADAGTAGPLHASPETRDA